MKHMKIRDDTTSSTAWNLRHSYFYDDKVPPYTGTYVKWYLGTFCGQLIPYRFIPTQITRRQALRHFGLELFRKEPFIVITSEICLLELKDVIRRRIRNIQLIRFELLKRARFFTLTRWYRRVDSTLTMAVICKLMPIRGINF